MKVQAPVIQIDGPHSRSVVIRYKYHNENVGEEVYFHILNHAKKYVHIMTPYLILDGEMEGALKYAAERGVEVASA